MAKAIDSIGQRFGRLTVISRAENSNAGSARWNCVCDCGGETIAAGQDLRSGNTNSCGCLVKEINRNAHLIHGMNKTPTHKSWAGMRDRCINHNNHAYKDYGGRGITICEQWESFETFYEDMGERPKGTSIDRRDNDKGYSPENCKWATQKEQNRNTRRNKMIKYQGKTQCIGTWAEELDINYKALWSRLQRHSPQVAFNM